MEFNTTQNLLWMYGNGNSMAIVLDHRSTGTSLTENYTVVRKYTVKAVGLHRPNSYKISQLCNNKQSVELKADRPHLQDYPHELS